VEVREERASKQCAPDTAESMHSLSLYRMTAADNDDREDTFSPFSAARLF
jgi:hypothetical protein